MNNIDDHKEIVKIRNELEEIKEEFYDHWHEDKEKYLKRVDVAIKNNALRAKIFLAIDGVRTAIEIENEINSPHMSSWRAFKHLNKEGITRLLGSKGGSPVYCKKPWVKVLHIDDYVKEKYREILSP